MPFLSLTIYRFSKAFLAGAMNMDRISFIAKTQRRWCKIRHVVSHMSSQSDGTASNQFGANQSTNQMDGKLQQPITRQQSWYNNCVVAVSLRSVVDGVMASKGKTFRSSLLCSPQEGDSFSENDEEVENILSQSQCESRKRSAQREDDCVPQHEKRETGVSSTEPAHVVGKFYMVFFRF